MILKAMGVALLTMSLAFAETPTEAHRKLAETYFKGEGHALVYQLSKESMPKGPRLVLNVAQGRLSSLLLLKAPDGEIMQGLGHYPTARGEKGSSFVGKGPNHLEISFGEDLQEILDLLNPEEERETSYFNPEIRLNAEEINLGAKYAVGGDKPYPWGPESLENIERVERKEGSVIFHGKDEERLEFEASSGLLLEHRMPAHEGRKMTLVSREKMAEFDKAQHGFPGKPEQTDEDLIDMARSSFQSMHFFSTLIAASRLLQLPEDQHEATLAKIQIALNQHHRKIGREQPYLSDPMGVKVILKNSTKRSLDDALKKAAAAGKDPIQVLKQERGAAIDTILRNAPRLAQMLAKKKLFGLNPEKVAPEERPALEKLIHAQKVAILRNLARQVTEEEIDRRIGKE